MVWDFQLMCFAVFLMSPTITMTFFVNASDQGVISKNIVQTVVQHQTYLNNNKNDNNIAIYKTNDSYVIHDLMKHLQSQNDHKKYKVVIKKKRLKKKHKNSNSKTNRKTIAKIRASASGNLSTNSSETGILTDWKSNDKHFNSGNKTETNENKIKDIEKATESSVPQSVTIKPEHTTRKSNVLTHGNVKYRNIAIAPRISDSIGRISISSTKMSDDTYLHSQRKPTKAFKKKVSKDLDTKNLNYAEDTIGPTTAIPEVATHNIKTNTFSESADLENSKDQINSTYSDIEWDKLSQDVENTYSEIFNNKYLQFKDDTNVLADNVSETEGSVPTASNVSTSFESNVNYLDNKASRTIEEPVVANPDNEIFDTPENYLNVIHNLLELLNQTLSKERLDDQKINYVLDSVKKYFGAGARTLISNLEKKLMIAKVSQRSRSSMDDEIGFADDAYLHAVPNAFGNAFYNAKGLPLNKNRNEINSDTPHYKLPNDPTLTCKEIFQNLLHQTQLAYMAVANYPTCRDSSSYNNIDEQPSHSAIKNLSNISEENTITPINYFPNDRDLNDLLNYPDIMKNPSGNGEDIFSPKPLDVTNDPNSHVNPGFDPNTSDDEPLEQLSPKHEFPTPSPQSGPGRFKTDPYTLHNTLPSIQNRSPLNTNPEYISNNQYPYNPVELPFTSQSQSPQFQNPNLGPDPYESPALKKSDIYHYLITQPELHAQYPLLYQQYLKKLHPQYAQVPVPSYYLGPENTLPLYMRNRQNNLFKLLLQQSMKPKAISFIKHSQTHFMPGQQSIKPNHYPTLNYQGLTKPSLPRWYLEQMLPHQQNLTDNENIQIPFSLYNYPPRWWYYQDPNRNTLNDPAGFQEPQSYGMYGLPSDGQNQSPNPQRPALSYGNELYPPQSSPENYDTTKVDPSNSVLPYDDSPTLNEDDSQKGPPVPPPALVSPMITPKQTFSTLIYQNPPKGQFSYEPNLSNEQNQSNLLPVSPVYQDPKNPDTLQHNQLNYPPSIGTQPYSNGQMVPGIKPNIQQPTLNTGTAAPEPQSTEDQNQETDDFTGKPDYVTWTNQSPVAPWTTSPQYQGQGFNPLVPSQLNHGTPNRLQPNQNSLLIHEVTKSIYVPIFDANGHIIPSTESPHVAQYQNIPNRGLYPDKIPEGNFPFVSSEEYGNPQPKKNSQPNYPLPYSDYGPGSLSNPQDYLNSYTYPYGTSPVYNPGSNQLFPPTQAPGNMIYQQNYLNPEDNGYNRNSYKNYVSPNLPQWGVTNRDKLSNFPKQTDVVELTYEINRPQPESYRNYYAKYRIPFVMLMSGIQRILFMKPYLRHRPEELYSELLSMSHLTEVSPNLRNLPVNSLNTLVANNGTLTKASVLNPNNVSNDPKEDRDLELGQILGVRANDAKSPVLRDKQKDPDSISDAAATNPNDSATSSR